MAKKPFLKKKSFWLRLGMPIFVVLVWLALAGVGGPYFSKLSDVSSNDLATFLPTNAESTRVKDKLEKFHDSSSVPLITVFESDKKIDKSSQSKISKIGQQIADSEKSVQGDISPLVMSDDEKAAFMIVPLDAEAALGEVIPSIRKTIEVENSGLNYALSGPAMFSRDLQDAFAGIDGLLLIVTLVVVFLILLFVYRSPILPLVTLIGAVGALAISVLVVWHLADAGLVQVNGQVQGILFILVIGAATDYSLLYISRYREELSNHSSAWDATKAAWKGSIEPIVAAGSTVSLGLLCLLASDLGSNRALGPVGGMGVVFAILVAISFLPAVLLLLGRAAFWPRRPKVNKKASHVEQKSKLWSRVAQFVSSHPRKIWTSILAVLLIACLAVPTLKAEGVSQVDLVLGESESREGQEMMDRHFPGGSGVPAFVVTPEKYRDEVVRILDADDSVESVAIMTSDEEYPAVPIGKSAEDTRSEVRKKVIKTRNDQLSELKKTIEEQMVGAPIEMVDAAYEQAVKKVPSVGELTDRATLFLATDSKVSNGDVALQATLNDTASSIEARKAVERLRAETRHLEGVEFGGMSAIQLDTNVASSRDLMVIIPLILVSITIVLMLLLRSVVAPLALLVITVISFGAAIGVSALLFNHVWNFPGAEPAVLIFGFVFLVALGIDYNIFLMTRAREETLKHGVREGMLRALVVTGGVITSAGVVLAATFAALSVIPILFLAEIAFIVAFGVLLDTLIVRSLLVPALTIDVGEKMWWPSKISKRKKSNKS